MGCFMKSPSYAHIPVSKSPLSPARPLPGEKTPIFPLFETIMQQMILLQIVDEQIKPKRWRRRDRDTASELKCEISWLNTYCTNANAINYFHHSLAHSILTKANSEIWTSRIAHSRPEPINHRSSRTIANHSSYHHLGTYAGNFHENWWDFLSISSSF